MVWDWVSIIIGLVAGAIGGWLLGMVMKNMSSGTTGDLIAGLIGGIILVLIGTWGNFLVWGTVPYIGAIVLGLVGGIILAAIWGAVRKNTMKA
jgi:uncharacterized membrane protein YeaQ/YmgE (transglycosylase-associated protein family)